MQPLPARPMEPRGGGIPPSSSWDGASPMQPRQGGSRIDQLRADASAAAGGEGDGLTAVMGALTDVQQTCRRLEQRMGAIEARPQNT